MSGNVYRDLSPAQLVEAAIRRQEGQLTTSGALQVTTGKYTGRSPNDKFIVNSPDVHDKIAWGETKPLAMDNFTQLYSKMQAYIQNHDIFIFNGFAGADPENRIRVQFINEFAWQNLFVHQLFICPEIIQSEADYDYKVICLPNFKADPAVDGTASEAFIVLNFAKRLVLIGGTHYAGEMKKSIFTVMNYILPEQNILSMHCSANVGASGDTALFFGLSGTGKTTLSADPARQLIGDDEHGWDDKGIFNIEGGCYAKCIGLTYETEPQIWEAIRFGAVLENVVIDPVTRRPDFTDGSITENTRVAYPVDYIPNALISGMAGHPQTIIFLTADAFGVLPPIAKLNTEQAMYHFLSGYTSKLAGTERGITEPQATFSTCFGAPFLPLSAHKYAELLGEKLKYHQTNVFLINTGWSGGPYGVGSRMKLSYTRAMVTAAIEGQLAEAAYQLDPIFNVYVPESCPGVPAELLMPHNTWNDKAAYERKAQELARLFIKNFSRFTPNVSEKIIAAGPKG
ncbi:Phosphoenolpyruvate carboxykinase [ATP] [Sporomusa ovata DSM 2662]|uniref:Phosphoenolpyruvate carboxykinase (ATP) n=1 Tax=Sporomusa ovata TaxID=2378 RepID=A0A0U1KTS1_9FIRM|nr:phosphoenolpyruvate carboxykinase (ATP) [Sporomusa ovata]EQB24877.1 phosphoenolpyruvate carboxykinase 2 [Sporomusa ovata DSM 2662]CQR70074.1 Phosphoenolpyruvate carboxykinase [ATP] [Sporomusa ovata]